MNRTHFIIVLLLSFLLPPAAQTAKGQNQDFVQFSNLPTLYINTYDGKAITSKTNYSLATMWRVEGDSIAVYDSLQIRGRGNSTWKLAKKPYRIKFSSKQKFLGKGYAKAKNWTLMANHVDKTLLRNALASFIAKRLGQNFVPASMHVDVALNGQYIGNYQVSDHVDVRKGRVEIAEQDVIMASDDTTDISGGYLLQLDGLAASDPVYFTTNTTGAAVSIKSPDEDVINPRQKSYIQNYVNSFERKLFSSSFRDKVKGYRPLIDSLSMASYFLTVEYSANADGYYSIYFYKDRNDPHLYFGPCWDYDIAFNNCYRLGSLTKKMMTESGYGTGRRWFYRAYSDAWFKQLSGRIWHRAIADGLMYDALAFVDSVAKHIDESQQLNFQRWDITQRTWDELMLFSTYQEGVDYLKRFLVDRAAYLSSQLPNPEKLPFPTCEPGRNPLGLDLARAYYIYNVGSAHPVDFLADGSNLVCGWEYDDSRKASQQWRIESVTGDYYRIVSPDSKLAITDMATETEGAYETGAQLQLMETDDANDRQLWKFVPTAGNYCIENKQTRLAWNNSHGMSDNGNPIISWTNNADNVGKTTRQWYLAEGDPLPDEDAIALLEGDVDYRITYDPVAEEVFIRIPNDATVRKGVIHLFDLQGRHIDTGTVGQPISMTGQPRGIYLLTWTVQGHSRSIKFLKP